MLGCLQVGLGIFEPSTACHSAQFNSAVKANQSQTTNHQRTRDHKLHCTHSNKNGPHLRCCAHTRANKPSPAHHMHNANRRARAAQQAVSAQQNKTTAHTLLCTKKSSFVQLPPPPPRTTKNPTLHRITGVNSSLAPGFCCSPLPCTPCHRCTCPGSTGHSHTASCRTAADTPRAPQDTPARQR